MTVPFAGTSFNSSTKIAPSARRPVHDVAVVNDLMAHIDRRAEKLDRALDDVDSAIDTRTEATGIGEKDFHLDTHLFRASALSPRIQEQQNRSDGDSRIRNVKRWKVMSPAPMGGNEVHHVTDAQPVDDVPEGTAQDERQAATEQALRAGSQAAQPGREWPGPPQTPARRTATSATPTRRPGS